MGARAIDAGVRATVRALVDELTAAQAVYTGDPSPERKAHLDAVRERVERELAPDALKTAAVTRVHEEASR